MRPVWAWAAIVALAGLPAAGTASVEIHPSGPAVPENLLRLELRFERAQRLPFDVERLKLLDGDGIELPHALLDMAVPDADGRRITVLLDPGRVKTGVGPNLAAGRALKQGATVSLSVADEASDAPPVVKTWRIEAAVSHPLQPALWRFRPPRRGTRDALAVDLRTPISSVGERLIAVVDGRGRRVDGEVTLADGDATWRFKPSRPWTTGRHRLVTHPDLEDPAGNRACAAFEAAIDPASACEGATLAFTPRGASRRATLPSRRRTTPSLQTLLKERRHGSET